MKDKYIDIFVRNRKNNTKEAHRAALFVLILNWELGFFKDIKNKHEKS